MLKLVAVRMINWHGYQDETVFIDGTTLVTGENGVGKTTLLDAIQYALVADQTRVRFNKANTGSSRKLIGYCRWLVSAEENDPNMKGKGTYLRGPCTSYVMLGWRDDQNRERDFVCGVVIDSGSGDSIHQQSHFVIPGITVGDVPAVNDRDEVNSVSDLRILLKQNEWSLIPDARTYRRMIGQRLATLDDNFYQPLVKALDFKPLGAIRPFIMDFLLEERPLETGRLLRNVENYQRIEAEARAAELRLAALRDILERHAAYERAKDELTLMDYIVLRARVDAAEEKIHSLEAQLQLYREQAELADRNAQEMTRRLDELKVDRDKLIERSAGVAAYIQREQLVRDLAHIEAELREIESAEREMARRRHLFHEVLTTATSPMALEARRLLPLYAAQDPFGDDEVVERCRTFLTDSEPDGRRQRSFNSALEDAIKLYPKMSSEARERLNDARRSYDECRAEMAELDRGHLLYKPELNALLHLLKAKLDYRGEIRPVCEFIEVTDPVWTDALEAMLGEDRFAIVLPPEYYKAARALYHRYKDGYSYPGSKGPVPLHTIKLIDMNGVLQERHRGARDGSLATYVTTTNSLVRAYVDYRIGDVMCVQRIDELHHHRRAVTPDVMVHQGHATFRMNPRHYQDHYIGQAARVRRREALQRRMNDLQQEISAWRPVVEHLEAVQNVCLAAFKILDEYMTYSAKAQERTKKERRAAEIRGQIDRIDQDPQMRTLNAERERLEAEIQKTSEEEKRAIGIAREMSAHASRTENEISDAVSALTRARNAFEIRFPDQMGVADKIREYEARYQDRRREGRSPAEIISSYEPQRSIRESAYNNRRDELRQAQMHFAAQYDLPAPERIDDVTAYRDDVERIEGTRLPEYRAELVKAKEEARRQLGEHYAYQLYDCFQMLKHAFDDINRALRAEEVRNNWGRYRFEWNLIPKYKDIYDLAYSVGTTGKDSLFNAEALAGPIGQELDRLTENLLKAGAAQVESSLITDYREFFDYDLVLEQKDGRVVRFANVSGVGSGGENQVPYYVAILSALYQMWRKHMPGNRPGCGLVLLDEAFSKMDEKNVDMVLDLARKFGLQLVLVTPGERVAVIAPRVETTLVIHRDNASANAIPTIRRFTREQILDAIEDIETNESLTVATA